MDNDDDDMMIIILMSGKEGFKDCQVIIINDDEDNDNYNVTSLQTCN